MADTVDKETRSRMMATIRSRDTRPELVVRQFLHRNGFRFRIHVGTLPGTPDIVLPRYRSAILVHGCFWHRHEHCRFATTPATNVDRWHRKFLDNLSRDRTAIARLQADLWHVIVIWECGLKSHAARSDLSWLPQAITSNAKGSLTEWPRIGSDSASLVDTDTHARTNAPAEVK